MVTSTIYYWKYAIYYLLLVALYINYLLLIVHYFINYLLLIACYFITYLLLIHVAHYFINYLLLIAHYFIKSTADSTVIHKVSTADSNCLLLTAYSFSYLVFFTIHILWTSCCNSTAESILLYPLSTADNTSALCYISIAHICSNCILLCLRCQTPSSFCFINPVLFGTLYVFYLIIWFPLLEHSWFYNEHWVKGYIWQNRNYRYCFLIPFQINHRKEVFIWRILEHCTSIFQYNQEHMC